MQRPQQNWATSEYTPQYTQNLYQSSYSAAPPTQPYSPAAAAVPAPAAAAAAAAAALQQSQFLQQAAAAVLSSLQRPLPSVPISSTPSGVAPHSNDICRDYSAGKCYRGATCRFLHAGGPAVPETCGDFMRGKCDRGSSCRYYHPPVSPYLNALPRMSVPALPLPLPYIPSALPAWSQDAYDTPKRELCRDYRRGLCKRGDGCRFLHDNIGDVDQCRDFLHGVCSRGDGCKFLHARESTDVCRDYINGTCTRGTDCKYFHGKVEQCRDFLNGTCTRGDKCRFLHNGAGSPSSPSQRSYSPSAPEYSPDSRSSYSRDSREAGPTKRAYADEHHDEAQKRDDDSLESKRRRFTEEGPQDRPQEYEDRRYDDAGAPRSPREEDEVL